MKKCICKKEYDTENAELIHKFTYGSFGQPEGFEECLFQTPDGLFFLYVNGGAASEHPNEDIRRMSKATAEKWQQEHM